MHESEQNLSDSSITAESLIRELESQAGASCASCGSPVCHHQLLMSRALGFKNVPHCLNCLARSLERDPNELTESLMHYIRSRECYRGAWSWATEKERDAAHAEQNCPLASLLGSEWIHPDSEEAEDRLLSRIAEKTIQPDQDAAIPTESEWNAGGMACGELVLELRMRLAALPPNGTMKLTALDTAAPEDLPAWCRLTGHSLLRAQPPTYWIQRKE